MSWSGADLLSPGSATSWLGDFGHVTFPNLSCPICKMAVGTPTSRDVVRMDNNVSEAPTLCWHVTDPQWTCSGAPWTLPSRKATAKASCVKRKQQPHRDTQKTLPAWHPQTGNPPSGHRRAGCRLPWLQLPEHRPLWLCQRSACTGRAGSVDGTLRRWYLEAGGEELFSPTPRLAVLPAEILKVECWPHPRVSWDATFLWDVI